jgi:RNA polymerase sigma factor (sigma-70 family)
MFIPLLQRERSIDEFVDQEQGCRLSALLADPTSPSQEDRIYSRELRGLVRSALHLLDDRERHIISNRFGLLGGQELTLEEIGKSLSLSRERVRQLERDAKEKLRSRLSKFRGEVRFSLA